tara:strand:- start:47 stop:349 length:303 start_codon:yes stop_codon:yes gene_type:complete
MAWQVIIHTKSDKAQTSQYFKDSENGPAAAAVVAKYRENGWLETSAREVIDGDDTHVKDIMLFVDKEKRESFKEEMAEAHGGDTATATDLEVTIVSEGEV